jgi:ABC-type branched-subunit amino acid transport system substrate-binding protein
MRLLNRSAAAVLALLVLLPVGAMGRPDRSSEAAALEPIVIGLHAPLTGAGLLPSQSLEMAADLYWKWLDRQGETVNGRSVQVVLKDDGTDPSTAVEVCREMIEEDDAFLLAGVLQSSFGSVQSQACARLAEDLGVPYVALGGATAGVAKLSNHFATSMTFRAQGRLLADYLVENLDARSQDNGLVSYNTPHEMEAVGAFGSRLDERRAGLDVEKLISRNGAGAAEAQAIATELKAKDIENVFVFTTPTFFIQLLEASDNLRYHPMWTGIGITMTNTDAIVRMSCSGGYELEGRFFSPLPAFGDRSEYDITFDQAMAEVYPAREPGATMWQGWSTAKQIHEMLEVTGRRLTTRLFVSRVEGADPMSTGIMPALDFSSDDHFGASKTYVLSPRCSDERWHTRAKKYR